MSAKEGIGSLVRGTWLNVPKSDKINGPVMCASPSTSCRPRIYEKLVIVFDSLEAMDQGYHLLLEIKVPRTHVCGQIPERPHPFVLLGN